MAATTAPTKRKSLFDDDDADDDLLVRRGKRGAKAAASSSTTTVSSKKLRYEGSSFFRQRLVMSILAGRPVQFVGIRADEDEPGLRDYEVSFLRLLDKITNGSKIVINETGTRVYFRPGVLANGRKLTHDCGTSRSIGYFVEHLLYLVPFGKKPLHIVFKGITNDEKDPSVDVIRTVLLPVMHRFGIEDSTEIKVVKRGSAPLGGGEVVFQCPIVRTLQPLRLLEGGKIKRIRGLVYTTRIPPVTANRVVDACRGQLNKFIPDVYIYTDHYTGQEAGKSPGYGLSLVAETVDKCLISAEGVAAPGELPEDLGKRVSHLLFEEIARSSCFDTQSQPLLFALMVLCPEDVSKVRIGKLSSFSIQFLRDIKSYFNVTFKLQADMETKTTLVSCVGSGMLNVNKKIC